MEKKTFSSGIDYFFSFRRRINLFTCFLRVDKKGLFEKKDILSRNNSFVEIS